MLKNIIKEIKNKYNVNIVYKKHLNNIAEYNDNLKTIIIKSEYKNNINDVQRKVISNYRGLSNVNYLLLELDKSLEQANTKSRPGVDGFSYIFIKKFWNILESFGIFWKVLERFQNTFKDIYWYNKWSVNIVKINLKQKVY